MGPYNLSVYPYVSQVFIQPPGRLLHRASQHWGQFRLRPSHVGKSFDPSQSPCSGGEVLMTRSSERGEFLLFFSRPDSILTVLSLAPQTLATMSEPYTARRSSHAHGLETHSPADPKTASSADARNRPRTRTETTCCCCCSEWPSTPASARRISE